MPAREYVYLLHFAQPISEKHTCQHYLGFVAGAGSLRFRLQHHAGGTGARLTQVARERSVEWELVRLWSARPDGNGRSGRLFERYLKDRNDGPRLCPVCNPSSWYGMAARHEATGGFSDRVTARLLLRVNPFALRFFGQTNRQLVELMNTRHLQALVKRFGIERPGHGGRYDANRAAVDAWLARMADEIPNETIIESCDYDGRLRALIDSEAVRQGQHYTSQRLRRITQSSFSQTNA